MGWSEAYPFAAILHSLLQTFQVQQRYSPYEGQLVEAVGRMQRAATVQIVTAHCGMQGTRPTMEDAVLVLDGTIYPPLEGASRMQQLLCFPLPQFWTVMEALK